MNATLSPRTPAPAGPRLDLVRRACDLLDRTGDARPTLAALAAELGCSPHQLLRAFQAILGFSPREYHDAKRLARFKAALRRGERVSPALYEAGYGSSSRVYERSDAQLGMTPATYRRGGAGAAIVFTLVDCPLGRLLVAATARGICQVKLGDAAGPLEAELRAEYPHAELVRDDARLAGWVGAIVRHLEGRSPTLALPTDVRATAFQQRVWNALRRIPYGATRTYAEIARAIGRPRAARAVAQACAANPVAIVVPCHRVVRGDGVAGGYRWGEKRKARLLETEAGGRAGRRARRVSSRGSSTKA